MRYASEECGHYEWSRRMGRLCRFGFASHGSTPRWSPKGESVATAKCVNPCRPSAVSQSQDAGALWQRSIASVRRCTRRLETPVWGARCRTLWQPCSQSHLKIRRLFSQNPMSVGALKGDCTLSRIQSSADMTDIQLSRVTRIPLSYARTSSRNDPC